MQAFILITNSEHESIDNNFRKITFFFKIYDDGVYSIGVFKLL